MEISLAGQYVARLEDGSTHKMVLPGSLDTNGIGSPDLGKGQWNNAALLFEAENKDKIQIGTRLTRKYTYTGKAYIERAINHNFDENTRVFVDVKRSRCLDLLLDDVKVSPYHPQSLSTHSTFEVTDLINKAKKLTFVSDNTYEGLPVDNIIYSSTATDETQTNWNGLLGSIVLRTEKQNFIDKIRIYTHGKTAKAYVRVDLKEAIATTFTLSSQAFESDCKQEVKLDKGIHEIVFDNIKLCDDVKLWDEYEGNLYDLIVKATGFEDKSTRFGVRDFTANDKGRLALNGRAIFVRSEANCCEFPETGFAPYTVEGWKEVLNTFKSYGVNVMRFHSHCPIEEAFIAADELGMFMQPELSHWNPKDAFVDDVAFNYYKKEILCILEELSNHPSFVMLSFGNELATTDFGYQRMGQLLDLCHEVDSTRLYTNGSNESYGLKGFFAKSDFYTAQRYYDLPLRAISADNQDDVERGLKGYLNKEYPSARHNFNEAMAKLREKTNMPVFGFEVGQFEVLPDFSELKDFKGITEPVNYRLILEKAKKNNLLDVWDRYVEATGELSLLAYREEVEAVLRTPSMSGLSLLGIQDFPGQGTALVGMLNAHLKPKNYDFAKPCRFAKFFSNVNVLAQFDKYTYKNDESFVFDLSIANYSKDDLSLPLSYTLVGDNFKVEKELGQVKATRGELVSVATESVDLKSIDKSSVLELSLKYGDKENTYKIWVYTDTKVEPKGIIVSKSIDAKVLDAIENGGVVYLSPDSTKEHLPHSIQGEFTTDFWSVGTFPNQQGGMGLLIDDKHPIFENFPTDFYTNYQWWIMAKQRAIIFDKPYQGIVTQLDSYAYMRNIYQLIEFKYGKAKILVSSWGLQNLEGYVEARALQNAIYAYLASDKFNPCQEIDVKELSELIV